MKNPIFPLLTLMVLALVASDGTLWVATAGGVWRRNDSGWEAAPGGTATARSVYQMAVEPSGTLYISTNGNGLFLKRQGDALGRLGGDEFLVVLLVAAA